MNEELMEVFWEGYRAYKMDLYVYDNPYRSEDEKSDSWKEGYYQAAEDD